MYKNIVVGAGMAGVVAARQLAEKYQEKTLIIEKRDHVGGNCFDVMDKHGILVHRYGPHIFHTDNEMVFRFLTRFTEWRFFGHEVVANIDESLLPVPFNLNAIDLVHEEAKAKMLKQKLIGYFGEGNHVPVLELLGHTDEDIVEMAQFVYKKIFLHYSMKQWGNKPEDVDLSVTARVPVRTGYDNRYFLDRYQGMPLNGYTKMFEKLLNHPLIEVQMNRDAKEHLGFLNDKIYFDGEEFKGRVIYTGPVDELFDFAYGALPYRTLDFVFEHYSTPCYQNYGVVNYTVSEAYTRITEFKHLTGQVNPKGTTVVKEYPRAYNAMTQDVPCYAIINQENEDLYKRYLKRTESYKSLHLLGRLAEYKYYNMDTIVERAMLLVDEIKALEEAV